MKLPSDYRQVVQLGVASLLSFGARLRLAAAEHREVPDLWLSVRDVEGLAARLEDPSEWDWQHGHGDHFVAPQDLAVLEELLGQGRAGLVQTTDEDATALRALRDFLRSYCDGAFEFTPMRPNEEL